MKKFQIISLLSVLLFLSSCMAMYGIRIFDVTDQKHNFSGKRIAVIAGDPSMESVTFARAIGKELKKVSSFNVMTHSQVALKVKGYPTKIQGPWNRSYSDNEIKENFSKSDKKKSCCHENLRNEEDNSNCNSVEADNVLKIKQGITIPHA